MKALAGPALLWAAAIAQAPAAGARLTLLAPADNAVAVRSAELSLLPSHSSNLTIDKKQIARLVAPGQPELWIVPVKFWHGEPSQFEATPSLDDLTRCGVFVMTPGGGNQYFLFTINGKQDMPIDQCGGLKAIARAGSGLHPDLKLTYRTFSPPRQEDTVNIQLLWDGGTNRYKVGRASD